MKLIIAGGRNYQLSDADFAWLDRLHAQTPVTEVVCGGATGADAGGKAWAEAKRIPVKLFLPGWTQHGYAAGPIRNKQMAEYANAVALFPGGRGTESMRREALAAGIPIYSVERI